MQSQQQHQQPQQHQQQQHQVQMEQQQQLQQQQMQQLQQLQQYNDANTIAMLNALENQNKQQYAQTQQVEINNLVNVLNTTSSNAFGNSPPNTYAVNTAYPNYVVSTDLQYQQQQQQQPLSPPQQQQQFVSQAQPQQQVSYNGNLYNYGHANSPFYVDTMSSMQQQPVQTNLMHDPSFAFMQSSNLPFFYVPPTQVDYAYNNNVNNIGFANNGNMGNSYGYSNEMDIMQQYLQQQQQQQQQLQQQQQQLAAQQYQMQFDSQMVSNNNNNMNNNNNNVATAQQWQNGYVMEQGDTQSNHGDVPQQVNDGQIEYESEEYEEGGAVEGGRAAVDEQPEFDGHGQGQFEQQTYYQ